LSYIPEYPPVMLDINSYEFKEWLNTVQNFYRGENDILYLSSYNGVSNNITLPLSISTVLANPDPGSTSHTFTGKLVVHNYKNCFGKIYRIIPDVTLVFKTGDEVFNFSPTTVASDTDVVTTQSQILLSTQGGWVYSDSYT